MWEGGAVRSWTREGCWGERLQLPSSVATESEGREKWALQTGRLGEVTRRGPRKCGGRAMILSLRGINQKKTHKQGQTLPHKPQLSTYIFDLLFLIRETLKILPCLWSCLVISKQSLWVGRLALPGCWCVMLRAPSGKEPDV